MKKSGLAITLAVAMAAITARAQYLELNINPACNQDIQAFTDGSNDMLAATPFSLDGIPFELAMPDNTPDTTGAVLTPGGSPSYAFAIPAETLAVVPEPTPYLMFGLGALILAFGRWRALRSRGPRR